MAKHKAKTGSAAVQVATQSSGPKQSAPSEEIRRMIAEAAYYRAEQRGFSGGSAEDDWHAAEAEIRRVAQPGLPRPAQQKAEIEAYRKLRREAEKFFEEVRDTVSPDVIKQGIDRAASRLKSVGEHSAETVTKVTAALRKDLADAAGRMGPKWEAFSDKSADLFGVWRDRGSLFLADAAAAVGGWLAQTGTKLERHTYDTGDMAAAGVFECTACEERITLKTAGHLPPCPRCMKTEFRRI